MQISTSRFLRKFLSIIVRELFLKSPNNDKDLRKLKAVIENMKNKLHQIAICIQKIITLAYMVQKTKLRDIRKNSKLEKNE